MTLIDWAPKEPKNKRNQYSTMQTVSAVQYSQSQSMPWWGLTSQTLEKRRFVCWALRAPPLLMRPPLPPSLKCRSWDLPCLARTVYAVITCPEWYAPSKHHSSTGDKHRTVSQNCIAPSLRCSWDRHCLARPVCAVHSCLPESGVLLPQLNAAMAGPVRSPPSTRHLVLIHPLFWV